MRKIERTIYICFTITLLSVLSMSEIGLVLTKTDEFSNPFEPRKISYYASSSSEYFNESHHPRYNLVANPIDLITYPHKGFPEIISYGEHFTVLVKSPDDTTDWEFYLKDEINNIFLNILHQKYVNNEWHFVVQPSIFAEGLYDLQLNCSDGNDYQTHAVKIVEEKSYPFNFIHLSDTHFPSYDIYNTTDINLQRIAEISELDVDFAILTGDLINGPSTMFLDPITDEPLAAEVGMKLALWALDFLNLPVYIIAGNHDLDSSTLLPDNPASIWKEYLGTSPVLNYSYLDWYFFGFGSTREGLNANDFNYIKSAISSKANLPNVLFYHSNYQNQATSIRTSFDIEMMLYGHEHHEEIKVLDNTLYYCQAPLFYNSSTVFSVINSTHVEMQGSIYDFTPLLETEETSLMIPLYSIISLLFVARIVKRKRKR